MLASPSPSDTCEARIDRSRASSVGKGARSALAGRDVGEGVVLEEDAVGVAQVAGRVLRLPVRAHDALVAADAALVLGGDAARDLERALAGQHHRAVAG